MCRLCLTYIDESQNTRHLGSCGQNPNSIGYGCCHLPETLFCSVSSFNRRVCGIVVHADECLTEGGFLLHEGLAASADERSAPQPHFKDRTVEACLLYCLAASVVAPMVAAAGGGGMLQNIKSKLPGAQEHAPELSRADAENLDVSLPKSVSGLRKRLAF